jgi:hypothetical protein
MNVLGKSTGICNIAPSMDLQFFTHYFLHLVFPGFLAWVLFPAQWKLVWFVFVLTMLVDADHLFADPLFDPDRCSIGFHPLHQVWAMGIYVLMLFVKVKWIRWISIGLLLHMAADYIDCIWMA